jgi:hypothetical protein
MFATYLIKFNLCLHPATQRSQIRSFSPVVAFTNVGLILRNLGLLADLLSLDCLKAGDPVRYATSISTKLGPPCG